MREHARVVAAGAEHCLAILDGAVYGWGDNAYGQVGAGIWNGGQIRTPAAVSRSASHAAGSCPSAKASANPMGR